jgi:hypothetical protein
MLLCFIFFKIVISFTICSSIPLLFDFSITFIAYFLPVAFSVTKRTVAKVPVPRVSPNAKTKSKIKNGYNRED